MRDAALDSTAVTNVESIFRALHDAGAKYVVVGGLAVVLHGHARLTADIDLVIDLAPGEAVKVLSALERVGAVAGPWSPLAVRIAAPSRCVLCVARRVTWLRSVAASFQAPVLFVLAQDLTRMRIIANVDEADIARLHERLVAEARVDAFPGEVFRGEVTEVRFGATVTSGVANPARVPPSSTTIVALRTGSADAVRPSGPGPASTATSAIAHATMPTSQAARRPRRIPVIVPSVQQ